MDKERSDKNWKLSTLIGIPVTAILTWVFAAGGIVNDVQTHTKEITQIKTELVTMDNRIRAVELGVARIEVQYKQILDTLLEIKQELKAK